MLEAVRVLAEEANIDPKTLEITGDALSSRFCVKFTGHSSAAANRVAQYLLSLRKGPGNFKVQRVQGPDAKGVNFFCNPDKNGSQIRREICAKLLKDVIAESLGDSKQVFVNRAAGTVIIDRKPIAMVVINPDESTTIQWKESRKDVYKLNVDTILAKFNEKATFEVEPWV